MTDWLNDCWTSPTTTSSTVCAECWTFYRQSSGFYSIQKLDSEDLDMALLGSTPYAASAARRGKLKAVAMAHIKGSAEALITRGEFTEPKQLSNETFKATIAVPKTSTTHYVALAVIANAGMDLTDVNLVFRSPDEIKAEWDAGTIDGACIWGTTMQYILDTGWKGASVKGRAMIDATTVAQWEYVTGNVLAASDAMLSTTAGRDLVEKLVAAFEQTRYDYTQSAAATKLDTGNWGSGGTYNNVVDQFAYLQSETVSGTALTERKEATWKAVAKFEYLSVADQKNPQEDKHDLPKMTQNSPTRKTPKKTNTTSP